MTIAALDREEESGALGVWRKHWIALVRRLQVPFFLLTAGVITAALPLGEFRAVGAGALLAALGWGMYELEDWRNDRYILTETTAINEQRKPLLGGGSRYEVPLAAVQAVSVDQKGWKRLLLGYGTVVISTPANVRGTIFWTDVPNPKAVRKAVDAARALAAEKERESLRRDVMRAVLEAQRVGLDRKPEEVN